MQLRVNIPIDLKWEDAVVDYPATGHPGVIYRKDTTVQFGSEAVSEALLFYAPDGTLAGLFFYFPKDIWVPDISRPIERAGNFTVIVAPGHRRRGVGTRLLREALKRWNIDFEQQKYTEAGAKLVQRYLLVGEPAAKGE